MTTELSRTQLFEIYPVWTADGRRVTFLKPDEGLFELRWVLADGSGPSEVVPRAKANMYPYAWTRDGKNLLYAESTSARVWNIGILSLDAAESSDL